jgi:hypothetical protein
VDDFTLDTATAEFHNILFGDPTAMELWTRSVDIVADSQTNSIAKSLRFQLPKTRSFFFFFALWEARLYPIDDEAQRCTIN